MGAATKLYISKRFELRDIKEVMENHLDLKVQSRRKKNVMKKVYYDKFKIEVLPTHDVGYVTFNFIYNGRYRTMSVFDNTDLAIKGLYELHLGHNEDSITIMRTIAEVLGGLLEENDCGDKGLEDVHGKLSEYYGLPYFLRYAIIHNTLKDPKNLIEFNEAIHKWYDEVTSAKREDTKLYPREEK
jgi:hypothetical protein